MMEVIFYGTRGSTPVSGRRFMGYGGNTTCIAIRAGKQLLVVDCGTGMQDLQREEFDNGCYKEASFFVTHLHWDHIQGIAFFAPFFSPKYSFQIYGEERYDNSMKEQIESIMQSPVFPVDADAFRSQINYHTIECGTSIQDGEVTVDTIRLNHPNICTGYRFNYHNKSVCVIADCEATDEQVRKFAQGCDLLIYDAQYTKEEYEDKKGWGHSNWEAACEFARECEAGRLLLTHHDPGRTDSKLHEMQEEAAKRFSQALFAFDGLSVRL